MKKSTESRPCAVLLSWGQRMDFAGLWCWSLGAWMKQEEMICAISAEATQSSSSVGYGREWVRCEHLDEAVEKDRTRTLVHGSVCTHCTARARVCGVKMQGRGMHAAGTRQVGQHSHCNGLYSSGTVKTQVRIENHSIR